MCYDDDFYYDEQEEDTFYAMTDGMYGSYEDWKRRGGNLDDLFDQLGY